MRRLWQRFECCRRAGNVVAAGTQGDIAVRVPDPVMFIGYWRNDARTRDKFRGE